MSTLPLGIMSLADVYVLYEWAKMPKPHVYKQLVNYMSQIAALKSQTYIFTIFEYDNYVSLSIWYFVWAFW